MHPVIHLPCWLPHESKETMRIGQAGRGMTLCLPKDPEKPSFQKPRQLAPGWGVLQNGAFHLHPREQHLCASSQQGHQHAGRLGARQTSGDRGQGSG